MVHVGSSPKPCGIAQATCPARDGRLVPPGPATAPGGARVALVGEAPTRTDLDLRRPWQGPGSRHMQRALVQIGVRPREVHVTNAVLCECAFDDRPKAARSCGPRLRAELAASGAAVVIVTDPLGLREAASLPKKPNFSKWRGSITPVEWPRSKQAEVSANGSASVKPTGDAGSNPALGTGSAASALRERAGGSWVSPRGASAEPPITEASPHAAGLRPVIVPADPVAQAREGEEPRPKARGLAFVMPVMHPYELSKAPKWEPIFALDLQRVARVLADGFTPPELQPGRRIVVARVRETLAWGWSEFAPDAELAFDVETVGLGPTSTLLVCFAFSDGDFTMVVPWSRGRDGREPWWSFPGDVARECRERLRGRVIVTHNGPAFDHVVDARYKCLPPEVFADVDAWEDTLLGAHALYSHLPKGLSFQATRYLDVTAWKEQEDRTADLERLWTYNGRDTKYTALVRRHQRKELERMARHGCS